MGSAVSKPTVLHTTCDKLGHTWTPSCRQAAVDLGTAGYTVAFKTYAVVYLVTALLRGRSLKYYLQTLVPEVLQSTLFLGTNGTLIIAFFCLLGRLLGGRYTLCSTLYIPTALASFLAILLERKQRRSLLAVYVTNVAVDTMYRMLVFRRLVRPINNGEVYLFSLVSAAYVYLYKRPGALGGAVQTALRSLIGSGEQLPTATREKTAADSWLQRCCRCAARLLEPLKTLPRHVSCRHADSCLSYIIKGGCWSFSVGVALQLSVRLLTTSPRRWLAAVFRADNLQLAAFLSSYTSLVRLVGCLLRWLRGRDSQTNGLVAGFIASASMFFYKSSTLTMYMGSKLLELLYTSAVRSGIAPSYYYGDAVLYSLSTALLFHVAAFERHNMRPAYWKFLLRITNQKFGYINYELVDTFGTQASYMSRMTQQ